MQTLINFLGRWRFNWVDMVLIWVVADLARAQMWGWAAFGFFLGVALSVYLHFRVEATDA